ENVSRAVYKHCIRPAELCGGRKLAIVGVSASTTLLRIVVIPSHGLNVACRDRDPGNGNWRRRRIHHTDNAVICVRDVNVSQAIDKYAFWKIKLRTGRCPAIAAGSKGTKRAIACHSANRAIRRRNFADPLITGVRDENVSRSIHKNAIRIAELRSGRGLAIASVDTSV